MHNIYANEIIAAYAAETAVVVTTIKLNAADGWVLIDTIDDKCAAITAAISAAEARADETNAGHRDYRHEYDNSIDTIDGVIASDSDATVLLAGKGAPVSDGAVADVLGTDNRDLLESRDDETVADAVREIINNTGAYVTQRQYLDHIERLYVQRSDDDERLSPRAWASLNGAGAALADAVAKHIAINSR